ncbi:MAG: ribonuclease P protein component [Phocaeicola sp.]
MMEERRYTLCKSERLSSKIMIDKLFTGGNKSFPAYPLRVVYQWIDKEEAKDYASILISVPKKRFKHAVKRNFIKRQVREAYRKNKHLLLDKLIEQDKHIVLAFLFLDSKTYDSKQIEERVIKILRHIAEGVL